MPVYCSLHHENPDGSAFCDECGEPLTGATSSPVAVDNQPAPGPVAATGAPQTCPSCGAQNPAGEAYCANCGVSLLGTPAPAAVGTNPATEVPPAPVSTPEPALAPAAPSAVAAAPAALSARLIVEADNQEFDLSGKDNVVIGREDAVSNIYPDV